ncbi:MAG: hypothetical protein HWD59_07765 [Coxiellaceae bacterium]|nr:MAG: hypothetical protein HWD59_07765 [Coxiellaceae bacterium]
MKLYRCLSLVLIVFIGLFAFSAYASTNADSIFISIPKAKNAQQEKSINLVKAYYDTYNKRDASAYFSLLSNNILYDVNQGKIEKGLKSFEALTKEIFASFNEKLDHIVILVSDDGKYAAASWVNHGTYVKDYPLIDIKAKTKNTSLMAATF